MINLNDKETRKKLNEAIASKEGGLIIDYLKQELDNINYDIINIEKPDNEVGQEFKVFRKTLEYFKKLIIFNRQ